MYEFCTLFDRNYLARGLVLHQSLMTRGGDFNLRVFCMDDETARLLRLLDLPRLEIVSLEELESLDSGLAEVKATRSHVEFMWTATPAVCLAALARDLALREITYLDADLQFFDDPRPIFEESGNCSVAIVPHRYAPRWQRYEATSGVYNVEWLTFRRDGAGLEALQWWRERCLEWCRAAPEDGKFGDQAYLNDWPQRFEGVHVLQHPGAGLAPWNLEAHCVVVDERTGQLAVDGSELIFFHHHGVRLIENDGLLSRLGSSLGVYLSTVHDGRRIRWRSGYPVTPEHKRLIWDPYMVQIMEANARIKDVEPTFTSGFERADLREILWVTRARLQHQTA